MPQYVVLKLAEIPDVGGVTDAKVVRVDGTDPVDGLKQAAQALGDVTASGQVYALVALNNVNRKTLRARPVDYDVA